MIRVLVVGLLTALVGASSASALDCTRAPDRTPGPFWRYRLIDNQQCWYRSESVLPKSDLRWAPDPRPELTMEFGDAPLKPTFVQTVPFKPVESPKESLGLMTFVHIGILAGFGLAIGGLLWPLRRGRKA